MLPLISVIIPVYNTESYLDRCMQSILSQTHRNMEIILVDDGSTDGSAKKCDEYARMDPRIRVFHKENGGQSSARNLGLDACSGDYISFVDSDDWIEPNMLSALLDQLETHQAPLAICGRYDAYEGSEKRVIGKSLGKSGLFDTREILPRMMIGGLSDFSVCDKLHRRDLWETLRFPEGEIYEDYAVMYKVVLAAQKAVLYDQPLYTYNHRRASTVTSGFRKAVTNYPKQTKQCLLYMQEQYPEFTGYALWAHIKAVQNVLIKLFKSDRETYRTYRYVYDQYVRDIKEYRSEWEKDPLYSFVDRVICRILLHRRLARLFFLLKK